MPEVTCRPATELDLPALADMYVELNTYFYEVGYTLPHPESVGEVWVDSFKRTLGRFSNVFIAELDSKPAGFILCRVKRLAPYMGGVMVGEVSDVWVAPFARRMGIAAELCRTGIDWMRLQDVHSIEVQVLCRNESSQKLFESLGFVPELQMSRLYLKD